MKLLSLLMLLSLPAFADNGAQTPAAGMGEQKGPPPGQGGMGDHKGPPPTKEQREQLAKIYEKFAACARSERMMQECGQEMMASCKSMPGGRCGPGGGGMKGPPPGQGGGQGGGGMNGGGMGGGQGQGGQGAH